MGYKKFSRVPLRAACALAVCACAVALAAASPVLLPEEEEVLAREAAEAETDELDVTDLAPVIIVPEVAIDLQEIPNTVTERTLIAVDVLADLGALDDTSDIDEEIGLDGSTSKPPPHVILEALPDEVINVTERVVVRCAEDASAEQIEGDDKTEEQKEEEYDAQESDQSPHDVEIDVDDDKKKR